MSFPCGRSRLPAMVRVMRASAATWPALLASTMALALVACQTAPQPAPASPTPSLAPAPTSTPAPGGRGGDAGGGQALGGDARAEVLAEATLERLPDGPLAWVGYAATRAAIADPVRHLHGPAFVYVPEGAHTLTVDGQQGIIAAGRSVFVGPDVEHMHVGQNPFWEIVLAAPDAPPPGLEDARKLFASPPLEGTPQPPVRLAFIRVELRPGSETSVHTHPGPEYIYVTQGEFVYQNAIVGTETVGPGDDHALPPDTAVQKRNPNDETAVFLSWFIVDPDKPFAPEAAFR